MAPNKIEIKREMLPIYQIKSTDFCNIPIDNITQLKLGIKLKKPPGIRIQSIRMAKIICWIQHTRKIEAEKNRDKNEKSLYKLLYTAKQWRTWRTKLM